MWLSVQIAWKNRLQNGLVTTTAPHWLWHSETFKADGANFTSQQ